jgi:hypothetical protein
VKPVRIALLGLVLVVFGAAAAAPAIAGASVPAEKKMLRKVNGARGAHGLRPLRASRSLGRSAGRYAHWMLRADYFGTSRVSGRAPATRTWERTWPGTPGGVHVCASRCARGCGLRRTGR